MLSQIRVTGMPRRCSSQAVSRAPWSSGRVSSAKTWSGLALLVGGEDDGQGGAVVGRGQAAGVAVGQDPLPRPDQRGAEAADGPAHRPVLVGDRAGLGEQPVEQLAGRSARVRPSTAAVDPVEGPEEVDGGRPAGAEVGGRLADGTADRAGVAPAASADCAAEHGPVGRGDPDRRRPADAERPDRLPDRRARRGSRSGRTRSAAGSGRSGGRAPSAASPTQPTVSSSSVVRRRRAHRSSSSSSSSSSDSSGSIQA